MMQSIWQVKVVTLEETTITFQGMDGVVIEGMGNIAGLFFNENDFSFFQ